MVPKPQTACTAQAACGEEAPQSQQMRPFGPAIPGAPEVTHPRPQRPR